MDRPFRRQRAKGHSIAHGFIDLLAVAPVLWRECHHCFVDLDRNRLIAVVRMRNRKGFGYAEFGAQPTHSQIQS